MAPWINLSVLYCISQWGTNLCHKTKARELRSVDTAEREGGFVRFRGHVGESLEGRFCSIQFLCDFSMHFE